MQKIFETFNEEKSSEKKIIVNTVTIILVLKIKLMTNSEIIKLLESFKPRIFKENIILEQNEKKMIFFSMDFH